MLKALDRKGKEVFIEDADPQCKDYRCKYCGEAMIQKRGPEKAAHFSHKGGKGNKSKCPTLNEDWHFDQTRWHSEWLSRLPIDNIEVLVPPEGKIRHFADAKFGKSIIEFVSKPISYKEFIKRNEYFSKMGLYVTWLFDCIDDYASGRITFINDRQCSWYDNTPLFHKMTENQFEEWIGCRFFVQIRQDGEDAVREIQSQTQHFHNILFTDKTYSVDGFVELIQKPYEPARPAI